MFCISWLLPEHRAPYWRLVGARHLNADAADCEHVRSLAGPYQPFGSRILHDIPRDGQLLVCVEDAVDQPPGAAKRRKHLRCVRSVHLNFDDRLLGHKRRTGVSPLVFRLRHQHHCAVEQRALARPAGKDLAIDRVGPVTDPEIGDGNAAARLGRCVVRLGHEHDEADADLVPHGRRRG